MRIRILILEFFSTKNSEYFIEMSEINEKNEECLLKRGF